jgi:hypothetical protein
MSEEERLTDNFQRLLHTTQQSIDKIKRAWKEKKLIFDDWECINENVLDFELIEKDITKIHEEIKQDNVVILGTLVTINKLDKFIEIKTYTQKGDKYFQDTKKGEFKSLNNLPIDVEAELENNESVTIQPFLS